VLAGDRIKFLELELIGFAARIFLCDIEKTSVSAADKLDQHSIRLGHCDDPPQGLRGLEDNAGSPPVKADSTTAEGAATGTAAMLGLAVIACTA
jgi:hypothetical protein